MKKPLAKILALTLALMMSISCAIVASALPQKVETPSRSATESTLSVDAIPETPLSEKSVTQKFQNFVFVDGFVK